MMKENQDSILVTLAQQTIKDRKGGYKQIISEWLRSDGERQIWSYKLGNAPKEPEKIAWVFWVIGGRIRYRSRLLDVVRNKSIQFSNQSKPMYAKAWLELFDFERIPRQFQIEKKGFQGFRYFDSNLIPC